MKAQIFDARKELPKPYEVVRLILSDGTVKTGAWTGTHWWAAGEVCVAQWQTMRPKNSRSTARAGASRTSKRIAARVAGVLHACGV